MWDHKHSFKTHVDASVRASNELIRYAVLGTSGPWRLDRGALAEYFGLQWTVGIGATLCLLIGFLSVRAGKSLSNELEHIKN